MMTRPGGHFPPAWHQRAAYICLLVCFWHSVIEGTPIEIDVTIPPSLIEGPQKGEVLFFVTHDPDGQKQSLTLPCKAEGMPLPKYYWLKNGDNFRLDPSRMSMQKGSGSLTFHEPHQDDEGSYQCVASNSAGKLYSDISHLRRSITISFPKGEPRVVTAPLGTPLHLPCENPGGYPKPSLHWVIQKSDGSLHSISSPTATVDDDGSLWFSSVVADDASQDFLYACAASSSTRTEYRMGSWVYLNVSMPDGFVQGSSKPPNIPPSKPSYQYVTDGEFTVLKGKLLRLFCLYGGYPLVQIKWWRQDGTDVSSKLVEFGKVLELEDIVEADQGIYFCSASNSEGETEPKKFVINVEAAPEFIEKPGIINQPQGENASFQCLAEGEPTPQIEWTINGQLLPNFNEETLSFSQLKPADKGVISCNVSNSHGYAYSSGFLNVLSLPPEILTPPKDTKAFLGSSVTLDCGSYGSPDPKVSWKQLTSDGNVIPVTESKMYTIHKEALVITSLTEESAATYQCFAENKYDVVTAQATVTLMRYSQVTLSMVNRTQVDQTVIFTCLIESDPDLELEVIWMKNDAKLNFSDQRYTKEESNMSFIEEAFDESTFMENGVLPENVLTNTTSILRVTNVRGKDSGVYSCIAKTEVDETEDSQILIVPDVPEAPRLDKVECGNREAFIHWQFGGGEHSVPLTGFLIEKLTDLSQGKWKVEEELLPASERQISVPLRPGRRYEFRVLAENAIGVSEPSKASDTCITQPAPPDQSPSDVHAEALDINTILVRWQGIEPYDQNGLGFRYIVQWALKEEEEPDLIQPFRYFDENSTEDSSNDGEWEEIVIEDWEQTEVQLEGLLPHRLYKIRVIAENQVGRGNLDNEVQEYSGAGVPVKSPENLRVRHITSSSAIAVWVPLYQRDVFGPLLGYEVKLEKIRNSTQEGDSRVVFVEGRSSSVTLDDLLPFTSYNVRARVKNKLHEGPFTKPISFTTSESVSSKVLNLKAEPLSSNSLLVEWSSPANPNGKITNYLVQYSKIDEYSKLEENGAFLNQKRLMEEITTGPHETKVKLPFLERNTEYIVTVFPRNSKGLGERETIQSKTEDFSEAPPVAPIFNWNLDGLLTTTKAPESLSDVDIDGNIDDFDRRYQDTILADTDQNGVIEEQDILDVNKDGKLNRDDINLSDINKDGVINEKDVQAGDRDKDGEVTLMDIGDANGDGTMDSKDIPFADRDGDGDLDNNDNNGYNVILQDLDRNGNIDEDDLIDIDRDGDIDEDDARALDLNKDGQLDIEDMLKGDKDNDIDLDEADIPDFNRDGFVDEKDLNVKDKNLDGIIDFEDYNNRNVFLADTNKDGKIDAKDVLDINEDGRIDEKDVKIANINKDNDISELDIRSGDKDFDGDVDTNDIKDLNNDGNVDYKDALLVMSNDIEHQKFLEDANLDGSIDEKDIDGDGKITYADISLLDINDDGSVDWNDLMLLDQDNDDDVDIDDLEDFNGDSRVDYKDLDIIDKDGDGDIDLDDVRHQKSLIVDVNEDGQINEDDLLDINGDGDINNEDLNQADLDRDGDVDEDDVLHLDKDGDGDVDTSDITDVNNDGKVNHEDFHVKDRDQDGDIDFRDYFNRNIFLADTNMDHRIDAKDILDVNEDGVIDEKDKKLVDINKDGKITAEDVTAGDVDNDKDVDIADVLDINGDSTVDYKDLILADKDNDRDIDADDRNGRFVLLSDFNKDERINSDDIRDVNGDQKIDQLDTVSLDINNDGIADFNDVLKGNSDNDVDIDAADVFDVDEDGDVDGKDLIAMDKDVDGDIDDFDRENVHIILKDTNNDGNVNIDDVLDNDGDGNITEEDIKIADINGDGKITYKDVVVGDMDKDDDVDTLDMRIKNLKPVDKEPFTVLEKPEGELSINWRPIAETHSGSGFYLEYRPEGSLIWRKSNLEEETLKQKIEGLDPEVAYEVRMVAKDGRFETPSEVQKIGPLKEPEETPDLETTAEEPTLGAVMDNGPPSPLEWTWFVIAVMASLTMLCAIFFSIWAYNQRLNNVSALRSKLYEGVQTSSPEEIAAKDFDAESGKLDAEEPLTAEKQRQQMSALLRRQETAQSVDSFASHDDDFAEYGDETMVGHTETLV